MRPRSATDAESGRRGTSLGARKLAASAAIQASRESRTPIGVRRVPAVAAEQPADRRGDPALGPQLGEHQARLGGRRDPPQSPERPPGDLAEAELAGGRAQPGRAEDEQGSPRPELKRRLHPPATEQPEPDRKRPEQPGERDAGGEWLPIRPRDQPGDEQPAGRDRQPLPAQGHQQQHERRRRRERHRARVEGLRLGTERRNPGRRTQPPIGARRPAGKGAIADQHLDERRERRPGQQRNGRHQDARRGAFGQQRQRLGEAVVGIGVSAQAAREQDDEDGGRERRVGEARQRAGGHLQRLRPPEGTETTDHRRGQRRRQRPAQSIGTDHGDGLDHRRHPGPVTVPQGAPAGPGQRRPPATERGKPSGGAARVARKARLATCASPVAALVPAPSGPRCACGDRRSRRDDSPS